MLCKHPRNISERISIVLRGIASRTAGFPPSSPSPSQRFPPAALPPGRPKNSMKFASRGSDRYYIAKGQPFPKMVRRSRSAVFLTEALDLETSGIGIDGTDLIDRAIEDFTNT